MKERPSCKKREKLAEECNSSIDEWKKTDPAGGNKEARNLKKDVVQRAKARAKVNNAKQAYDEHIEEHGC